MRLAVIAAGVVVVLPLSAYAQTRPAPDPSDEATVFEDRVSAQPMLLVDALRVMVVTTGIIGGFIAADIISGGVLTAPLLSGGAALAAEAAGGGVRAAPRVAPRVATLRPVIAPLGDSSTVGQALRRVMARRAEVVARAAPVALPRSLAGSVTPAVPPR